MMQLSARLAVHMLLVLPSSEIEISQPSRASCCHITKYCDNTKFQFSQSQSLIVTLSPSHHGATYRKAYMPCYPTRACPCTGTTHYTVKRSPGKAMLTTMKVNRHYTVLPQPGSIPQSRAGISLPPQNSTLFLSICPVALSWFLSQSMSLTFPM